MPCSCASGVHAWVVIVVEVKDVRWNLREGRGNNRDTTSSARRGRQYRYAFMYKWRPPSCAQRGVSGSDLARCRNLVVISIWKLQCSGGFMIVWPLELKVFVSLLRE